jgi:hypothetical protein
VLDYLSAGTTELFYLSQCISEKTYSSHHNGHSAMMSISPAFVKFKFFKLILDPRATPATNRPIMPAPGGYDDVEIGGMIHRGNRSTRRKPAPLPLLPPQTPHAAQTRILVAVLGNQRLTA